MVKIRGMKVMKNIVLEEDTYKLLDELAKQENKMYAELIRECINEFYDFYKDNKSYWEVVEEILEDVLKKRLKGQKLKLLLKVDGEEHSIRSKKGLQMLRAKLGALEKYNVVEAAVVEDDK